MLKRKEPEARKPGRGTSRAGHRAGAGVHGVRGTQGQGAGRLGHLLPGLGFHLRGPRTLVEPTACLD